MKAPLIRREVLDRVFKPRCVAVIGLSRAAVESPVSVLTTLRDFGYPGTIYIINPNMETPGSADYHVCATLEDVPEPVDVAVVSVSREHVLGILRSCARTDIRAAIVITQGFADADAEGRRLQEEMVAFAAENGIGIVGPNTIGVSNAFERFTSSFIEVHHDECPIGIVSQSGLFMMGYLLVNNEPAGFSMSIDLGNGCDIDVVDVLEYYAAEDRIAVIQCHMEGIERGRAFIDTAARVGKTKPIIVLKAGRTESGKMAVASHSGAAAGESEVYAAAFRKAGAVVAESAEELRMLSKAFATYSLPKGERVAIMSFSGGGAILAIDAVDLSGLTLATLADETVAQMRDLFPSWLTVANPLDVWIPVSRDFEAAYPRILELVLRDPGVDAVICVYCSYTMPKYAAFDSSRHIGTLASRYPEKPILCWSYGMDIAGFSKAVERQGNAMVFRSLEEATATLAKLNAYRTFRDRSAEATRAPRLAVDDATVESVLAGARSGGRDYLFTEAFTILEACGIETAQWDVVRDEEALAGLAHRVRYPACLKVVSEQLVHKTDGGGIELDIGDERQLLEAHARLRARVRERAPEAAIEGVLVQSMAPRGKEVMIGARRDRAFGPCMVVGAGGIYTEVVKDYAFRVAPISETDAYEMIAELAFAKILSGVRGEPTCDIAAVVSALCRLAQLVCDHPVIAEIDVNPLIVTPSGAVAVDARIMIAEEESQRSTGSDDVRAVGDAGG